MSQKTTLPARLCAVCGARVRNQNQLTKTCDETCTAALRSGRTRVAQIAWELEHPNPHENPLSCATCGYFLQECQCVNGFDGD